MSKNFSLTNPDNFERLIEIIKKYPVIYNQSDEEYYKSARSQEERKKAFDEIAEEFNTTGAVIKDKWKNIREMYGKYLQSRDPNLARGRFKKNKNWKWASRMEYFKPYLKYYPRCPKDESKKVANKKRVNSNKKSHHNETESDEVSSEDNFESIVINEDAEVSVSHAIPITSDDKQITHNHSNKDDAYENKETDFKDDSENKNRRYHHNFYNDNKNINLQPDNKDERNLPAVGTSFKRFESQQTSSDRDAIELIFSGYAKIIKSFSKKRQAVAKLKIAKIIMEEELENAKEKTCSLSKTFHNSRSRSSSVSSR